MFRIARTTTTLDGTPLRHEIAFGITSLSQVRTGAGPHVMASLRNLAISLLRMAGCRNIADGLRACAHAVPRPLRLLGVAT